LQRRCCFGSLSLLELNGRGETSTPAAAGGVQTLLPPKMFDLRPLLSTRPREPPPGA
jgi:hypothetical protein